MEKATSVDLLIGFLCCDWAIFLNEKNLTRPCDSAWYWSKVHCRVLLHTHSSFPKLDRPFVENLKAGWNETMGKRWLRSHFEAETQKRSFIKVWLQKIYYNFFSKKYVQKKNMGNFKVGSPSKNARPQVFENRSPKMSFRDFKKKQWTRKTKKHQT